MHCTSSPTDTEQACIVRTETSSPLLSCNSSYLIVLFCVLFWCPYMVINVSVQFNGGFLPEIILLTLYDNFGESLQYHVEFLSLQAMFPL